MKKITTVYKLIAAVTPILLAAGCGGNGAANNDQGASVTLLGFYSSLPAPGGGGGGAGAGGGTFGNGATCSSPTQPLNYLTFRLGQAQPEPDSNEPSSGITATIGVQNNLIGQFFRADRTLLSYYIPGATSQPPDTNAPLALLAGPASLGSGAGGVAGNQGNAGGAGQGGTGGTGGTGGAAGGTGGGASNASNNLRRPAHTSLPPSFSNVCNQAYAQTLLVPAAVREWMNFNRESLPEPPFSMEVYVTVSGLSSGGNRIDTNTAAMAIEVLPEVYVAPTAGSDTTTPDTGATSADGVDSFGGDGSGDSQGAGGFTGGNGDGGL